MAAKPFAACCAWYSRAMASAAAFFCSTFIGLPACALPAASAAMAIPAATRQPCLIVPDIVLIPLLRRPIRPALPVAVPLACRRGRQSAL